MQRMTITTGAGFDASGQALDPAKLAEALATARGYLAATFGGYTETETLGGWVDPRGQLVTEPGRRFVVLSEGQEEPERAAERIREAFAQESVVLELEPVSAYFVTAPAPERADA